MATPHILAIDLGTSGPKVALVSVKGEVAGYEYHPTETHFLPGGGAEQEPEAWWRAVLTASRKLLERELVPREDIIAISCTSMWSSTVALDAEGRPLRPAMIWMDARGAPAIDRITRGFPRVEGYALGKLLRWIRRTGGAPAHSGKGRIFNEINFTFDLDLVNLRGYPPFEKFIQPEG